MCSVDKYKRIKGVEFGFFLVQGDQNPSSWCCKHHRLLVVTRYLHIKLDIYGVPALLILGRLEKAVCILGVLDVTTELLQPRLIKKVVVSCILV